MSKRNYPFTSQTRLGFVAAGFLVVGLVIGIGALNMVNAHGGDTSVLHTCVIDAANDDGEDDDGNKSGKIRVVTSDEDCRKNETSIHIPLVTDGNLDVTGSIKAAETIFAGAFSGNSPIIFEAPAGIERVRIDDITGNLGIGTVNPQSAVHVIGYTQIDVRSVEPPSTDCDEDTERGRLIIDSVGERLYLCFSSGWGSTLTGGPTTLLVDCSVPGESIEKALQVARPGDTIQISGNCTNTAVVITTDDLTLEGIGGPVIDGASPTKPVILINGAKRVTVKDLTVRFGADGIQVRGAANVDIERVTVEQAADDGIHIDEESHANLTDISVSLSSQDGIIVEANSSTEYHGSIATDKNGSNGIIFFSNASGLIHSGAIVTTTDNGNVGILVTTNSSLSSFGGTINTSGNGSSGIGVFLGSRFLLLRNGVVLAEGNLHGVALGGGSKASVQSSSLTTRNNSEHGIQIFSSEVTLIGGSTVSSGNGKFGIFVFESSNLNLGGDAFVEDNKDDGIHLNRSAHLNARPDSNIRIRNNTGHGLSVFNQSSVDLVQGTVTTIEGNGKFGLEASGNTRIGLNDIDILSNDLGGIEVNDSSLSISDSTITGNGDTDFSAFFGSRITLNNNVIGITPISCDISVISRGDILCNATPPPTVEVVGGTTGGVRVCPAFGCKSFIPISKGNVFAFEGFVQQVIPYGGLLSNFSINTTTVTSIPTNHSISVLRNGSSTGISCVIAFDGTACSDGSVASFNRDDVISIVSIGGGFVFPGTLAAQGRGMQWVAKYTPDL